MNELLLVVKIAGQRVAIRTSQVQSVIEIDTLVPVPRAPAHVAGLSALRSRVLTAIDCERCVYPGREKGASAAYAAVVEHDGHSYALLVEAVEDVTVAQSSIEAVAAPLEHGWADITLGMVETPEGPLLVINTDTIINGPADTSLAA